MLSWPEAGLTSVSLTPLFQDNFEVSYEAEYAMLQAQKAYKIAEQLTSEVEQPQKTDTEVNADMRITLF